MLIQKMFVKPIDRDIKGVIKVGQDDDGNVRQELEEYVVTRELERHFRDFFTSYKKGILGQTDAMGVWISGFFGSGKSHFLKILSYLLDNSLVVNGKRPIQYFVDDDKIHDSTVMADMQLASSTPTDVILFNIDSKSQQNGKQSKDAIVSVFLRVFNEMQGFCGAIPHLADLERRLSEQGQCDAFKAHFEEMTGQVWEEARNDFDFIQDDVVDVLVDLDIMSEDAARNWCEKATGNYYIAIEDFAKLVQRYIERKGGNHHVVFLVDEIGQYIGDDSTLMLNLQTLTENLGIHCKGKAWIIVTSQQDIDSITRTKGNDFSKIQGRFETRLSLSSANVDEVIRQRILAKNDVAHETLTLLYDDKITFIKNLILFNDGVEKKLYADAENFSQVYPFIPYQFNLLASVLTAVRIHGASGKHLSEGERSMLAVFKESAVKLMNAEQGALVPFHMFYDALEQFLDHSHSGVISRALDNELLNPDRAEECFDVNVLKTLFLIKYVKEIRANLEQITSLMVDHVDNDRLALRQRVEDALKRLEKQTLIQKNGDIYVFLTNEEQEINRAIDQQSVEQGELTAEVSKLIFDDLYDERKYRYPSFNGRYQFAFNQVVDDRPYKANQSFDLTLRVLTPNSDESRDEHTLRAITVQNACVLVVLPDDRTFLTELQMALKIEKFIRYDAAGAVAKFEEIKDAKRKELRDRREAARIFLEEALKDADIYVKGERIQSPSRDIKARINDALSRLVGQVYHKLTYIDTPASDADIRGLLKSRGAQITMDVGKSKPVNELALNDVGSYINMNASRHVRTSMKSLLDRFMAAPYGFIEADVQWLVMKLFTTGDLAFFVNNEPVTVLSKTEDEIYRFVTRREYTERLMIDRREKITEPQKRAAREVMKELFGTTPSTDDDDMLMETFRRYAETYKGDLARLEMHYATQPAYPGKAVVSQGKALMNEVLSLKYSNEFYAAIDDKRDDFLDLAEEMEPVNAFFAGEQKKIFDKALMFMRIYEESKNFLADEALASLARQISDILRMKAPYREIVRLPGLIDDFRNKYDAILNDLLEPALAAVADARKRVFDELHGKKCYDKLVNPFIHLFDELKNKAESTNNVATLQNIKIEADALKVNLLNRIAQEEAKLTPVTPPKEDPGETPPAPPVKQQITVSIKSVIAAATWQLETPEDVHRYVAELEKKLNGMLKENTTLNIEF